MLLITCIGIVACFLLQVILSSKTKKDNVFIYSILICATIALIGGLLKLFNSPIIDAEALVYVIASVIIQGIVGGAIGFNFGLLFFRGKFQGKK